MYKLSHQFGDLSGRGGAAHLSDLVGAGSEEWGKDGRKENGDWERGAPGLRESGWQDIRDLLSGSRKRSAEDADEKVLELKRHKSDSMNRDSLKSTATMPTPTTSARVRSEQKSTDSVPSCPEAPPPPSTPPPVFRNLTMYLNGSTAPLVSDHKLKSLFVQHGGNSSFALGRRTCTHVIIGNTCGGGLASGKINKEIKTVGGKGIKYVTAQWVLDSVEKGIRQPEARYVPKNLDGRIAGSGQGSVRAMFKPRTD